MKKKGIEHQNVTLIHIIENKVNTIANNDDFSWNHLCPKLLLNATLNDEWNNLPSRTQILTMVGW